MNLKVPITIELSEKTLTAIGGIVEGDAPLAHKLEAYANEVILQVANGAMVLDSDAVDRIKEADETVENSDDIVALCERSNGVDSGEYVIRFPRDPALTASLIERADVIGVPLQQLITDVVSMVLANGWFYDLSLTSKAVFFSYQEAEKLNEQLGVQEFCSVDVINGLDKALELINDYAEREERIKESVKAARDAAAHNPTQVNTHTITPVENGYIIDGAIKIETDDHPDMSAFRAPAAAKPATGKNKASKRATPRIAEAPPEPVKVAETITVPDEEEASLFA